MRYFRADVRAHGNERKTEPSDNEVTAPKVVVQKPLPGAFLPPYGTKRARFCDGKRPWMKKSMGRKRKSTGRNGRFMGCFGKSIPRMCVRGPPRGADLPVRRREAPVRFNALPNGAQAPGHEKSRPEAAWGVGAGRLSAGRQSRGRRPRRRFGQRTSAVISSRSVRSVAASSGATVLPPGGTTG